jgi:ApbE superfamily uncharacterized protein (UPF0280 family)
MTVPRVYERFAHQDANFRICCDRIHIVQDEIRRQRSRLQHYIDRHAEFGSSLEPTEAHADAPQVAKRMAAAAAAVGVGPMAAVAGTMAQLAAEAALRDGADEAIVENGGDIYLASPRSVVVGLYAGDSPLIDRLALEVGPEQMPLALCSSSSRMGHSFSLGACDLATVASRSASLADAAATQAANLVKTADDLDDVLEKIGGIEGIDGVLLVKDHRIGLIGRLGELVPNRDVQLRIKVTRDPSSVSSKRV